MKTAGLLVLILLGVQGQQSSQLPKDPIKDFKLRRTDLRHDAETGKDVEEISLILKGDEAIPIDEKKKIFDLRGVTANYFTDPEKGKLSKEIQVTAKRGHYDYEARTLQLDDDVRAVRKNDDETPQKTDTVLTASTLLLHFNQVYECPACRKRGLRKVQQRPGRCPDHNIELQEATVTSVEAKKDFQITGPDGIMSGEGLLTDDAINKDYHIEKNGFVEYEGNPQLMGGDAKAAPAATPQFSQIFSRGPLAITGPEDARTITGKNGMRIDRIDASGTLTMTGQQMTIHTVPAPALNGKTSGAPTIGDVDAAGKVILEGVLFVDGTAFHTTSDTLTRRLERKPNPETTGRDQVIETTDLKSTGESLVHVKSGLSTIESRSVRMTHVLEALGGEADFEDVERSELVAGSQHFNLKCDHLHTVAEPDAAGRTNLRKIVATRNVLLGGLMSAGSTEDPGKAKADLFEWDVLKQRGLLEATPLVHVTQGPSTITAPRILLESPEIFVLKGPKQVHMVQERDGLQTREGVPAREGAPEQPGAKVKDDYFATCDGDLVLDQHNHRLTMRDRCVIRTTELLVHSDRVNAKLSEAGGNSQGLESLLALGRVSALRRLDHTTIYGDRLAYDFKNQNLQVYGLPYTVIDSGRAVSTQEQIRVYDKVNPRTKLPTRYTELVGSADGVRIEMEEKATPERPPRGKQK
jgi:lipopolysaccharide export system protein LptA